VDNGLCHSRFFGYHGKNALSRQQYSRKTIVSLSDFCLYADGRIVVPNVQTTKRMGDSNDYRGVSFAVCGNSDSEGVGEGEGELMILEKSA
jgi:hypothetical protein